MKLQLRLFTEARKHLTLFVLAVTLSLSAGILGILQAREISRLVNLVFLEKQGPEQVSYLFIILFVIMLLRAGFSWFGELYASAGARKIKNDLRHRLYAHISRLGPVFLRGESADQETRTGELTTTAIEGMDALEVYFSQYLPQMILAALIPFSILIFVFQTDLLSAIVLLITAPLLPLFMYLIGSAAEVLTRKQWAGLSRMSAYFLDILQGMTTLKVLGRNREQVEVVKHVSEGYRQSTMQVLKVTFLSSLTLELIATLSTAVVAVEIGLRLLYGKMAFEQAFFVLLLAPEFYHPLRTLGARFHAGMAGMEAAKRTYAIFDTPIDHGDSSPGTHEKDSSDTNASQIQPRGKIGPPSIAFKNVGFGYSTDHLALNNLSCELPAGKITALVGESGSGKTTLTWLLMRFLHPQNGEILVDGKKLDEIPPAQWRQQLAWVPQNPYLFDDSVMANIKMSRPGATDEEVRLASRQAHAEEFIEALPQGYATRLGEQGARLSAGQAQRIALARAFLKDTPLLILDEATSHLDPELDEDLQDSIQHLAQNRTVLVIAHHRKTASRAHQVIRLSAGRLVDAHFLQENPPVLKVLKNQASHPAETPNSRENALHQIDLKPAHKTSPSVEMRLVRLLLPFAGRITLSTLLGFATIASGVGLMATAAYLISGAALHPSIADLQLAIVGVRFFGLSRGVFRYLERLVSHDVTFRLLARWRTWFYQALEPLAPARLLQYHSGDLLSRVIGDIGTLENFYVRAVSPPLVAVLVSTGTGILLGAFEPAFGWALAGFFVLAGMGVPLLSHLLSRQYGPKIISKRAELSRAFVDGIQGLPDLLTNGQAVSYESFINRTGTQLSILQGRMSGVSALYNALGSLLASLSMLTILALATVSISQHRLDGVLLGVVALAALTSFEAMQPLPQAAQNYTQNRAAASRLYELVDSQPAVVDPSFPQVLTNSVNLEIRDISFQYPRWKEDKSPANRAQFALKNISFSLPQGKHIAIVGHSGAGKTTLINLLMRFWEYPSGSIQLNGVELRDFNQDEIRKHMAVISQNTYLFSASMMENLRMAKPDATLEQVSLATRAARLDDVIQALPDKYNTWIGEHGLRLSAGERQRLAIARALLLDAPLLILDEPTANLDPVNEQAVLESIREISRGKSLISITQRIVGLEVMDEILVLREGKIIESGTHADLLARNGQYFKMWQAYNQMI